MGGADHGNRHSPGPASEESSEETHAEGPLGRGKKCASQPLSMPHLLETLYNECDACFFEACRVMRFRDDQCAAHVVDREVGLDQLGAYLL